MIHFKALILEWAWIFAVGLVTATQSPYKDDIHKIVVTVISMVLGAIASHYVKKFLNRKK